MKERSGHNQSEIEERSDLLQQDPHHPAGAEPPAQEHALRNACHDRAREDYVDNHCKRRRLQRHVSTPPVQHSPPVAGAAICTSETANQCPQLVADDAPGAVIATGISIAVSQATAQSREPCHSVFVWHHTANCAARHFSRFPTVNIVSLA
jgi:hypothetical protein